MEAQWQAATQEVLRLQAAVDAAAAAAAAQELATTAAAAVAAQAAADSRDTIAGLTASLQDAKSACADLQHRLQAADKQRDDALAAAPDAMALASQLAAARAEAESLAAQVRDKDAAAAAAQAQLADAVTALDVAKGREDALMQQAVDVAQLHAAALQDAVDSSASAAASVAAQLTEQLAATRQQLEDREGALAQALSQASDVQALQASLNAAEASLRALTEELQALQQRAEQDRQGKEAAEAAAAAAAQAAAGAEERVEQLTAQVAALLSQVAASSATAEDTVALTQQACFRQAFVRTCRLSSRCWYCDERGGEGDLLGRCGPYIACPSPVRVPCVVRRRLPCSRCWRLPKPTSPMLRKRRRRGRLPWLSS